MESESKLADFPTPAKTNGIFPIYRRQATAGSASPFTRARFSSNKTDRESFLHPLTSL